MDEPASETNIPDEPLALVDEAARLLMSACDTAGRTPKQDGERWLQALQRLERLERPLIFTRAHEAFDISGAEAICHQWRCPKLSGGIFTAVCGDAVMCGGVHYAKFEVKHTADHHRCHVAVGVVSADLNPRSDVPLDVGCHPMSVLTGWCDSGQASTGGQPPIREGRSMHYAEAIGEGQNPLLRFPPESDSIRLGPEASCVGLQLDLEHGTLIGFHESGKYRGLYVGVIATELEGTFCWAAEMHSEGDAVVITSAPPRSPPELLAARRRRDRLRQKHFERHRELGSHESCYNLRGHGSFQGDLGELRNYDEYFEVSDSGGDE